MAQKKTKRKPAPIKFQDETKVHPVLREYFGYCLFKVSARLRALMDKALEPRKIQTHHLGILRLLENIGPTSQIDLGDALGFDKASMVKLIDHLESLKFVTRQTDAKDRRVKNIQITAKGRAETETCIFLKGNVEKEFFMNIKMEERETLRRLIPKLLP